MIAAVGDAALGAQAASFWTAALNNPVNARFVADFEKKYNRLPSFYAAAGFDTALLLDNAIRAVGGKVADRRAFRKAIADAQFDAARGRFKFNTNHIPLSDFYLTTVSKDDKGRYVLALGEKILSDHKDAYADQCKYPAN